MVIVVKIWREGERERERERQRERERVVGSELGGSFFSLSSEILK